MFDSAWNCVCKRSFTIGDSFPPLLSTKNYLFEVCSRLLGFPPPEFTLLFVTVELFSIIFSFGLFLPCPSKFSHFNKSSARSPKKPWSGLSLFTKSVSTKPLLLWWFFYLLIPLLSRQLESVLLLSLAFSRTLSKISILLFISSKALFSMNWSVSFRFKVILSFG